MQAGFLSRGQNSAPSGCVSSAPRRKSKKIKAAGRHSDGGGLCLLIGINGGRSWVFRYRRAGGGNELGLGPANKEGGEPRWRPSAPREPQLCRDALQGKKPFSCWLES
ncbi:Arm DNA-binding domain-containing protein [Bradyrhizobium sp. 21]|uniref:Arm DNA-binding domain-containing protein n=1 Tax=Bradyrhizobium sp. 21 TaxID=2782666 RepID=UPI003211CA00